MKNRKTLVKVTCQCGESLGSWSNDEDWNEGYGNRAIRNMSVWRVWLWELLHIGHSS